MVILPSLRSYAKWFNSYMYMNIFLLSCLGMVFLCVTCGKRYTNQGNLTRHQVMKHGLGKLCYFRQIYEKWMITITCDMPRTIETNCNTKTKIDHGKIRVRRLIHYTTQQRQNICSWPFGQNCVWPPKMDVGTYADAIVVWLNVKRKSDGAKVFVRTAMGHLRYIFTNTCQCVSRSKM